LASASPRSARKISPITGEEVAAPSIGYVPPDTEENRRRFKGWWKVANQEHFLSFWFIGALLLVALCVLVFSSIGVQENIGTDLAFVENSGKAMREKIAPWFEEFFFIAGFVMLSSTDIGIMDYVGRITGDSLKMTVLRNSEFCSESKIYGCRTIARHWSKLLVRFQGGLEPSLARWYNLLGFRTWAMEPAHPLLLERRTGRPSIGLMAPDHGVR
jgi:hypothetical protein